MRILIQIFTFINLKYVVFAGLFHPHFFIARLKILDSQLCMFFPIYADILKNIPKWDGHEGVVHAPFKSSSTSTLKPTQLQLWIFIGLDT